MRIVSAMPDGAERRRALIIIAGTYARLGDTTQAVAILSEDLTFSPFEGGVDFGSWVGAVLKSTGIFRIVLKL